MIFLFFIVCFIAAQKITRWKGIELYSCSYSISRIECTSFVAGDISRVLNGQLKLDIPTGLTIKKKESFVLSQSDDDILNVGVVNGNSAQISLPYNEFIKIKEKLTGV